MDSFLADLRQAVRALKKSPGFTAIAALALALGIGANTTLFSVISFVLLRPVPYPEPARLLIMNERGKQLAEMSVAYPNFLDWRAQTGEVFSQLAAYRRESFNLTGAGEPERLQGRMTSASLFPALGVQARLGRLLQDEDDRPGAPRTVVLTSALWQRRFGGDPAIVGQSIQLSGNSYTVVGVLPASFTFLRAADLYVPIGLWQDAYSDRDSHPGITCIARMKPGVTFAQSDKALQLVAERLEKQYPNTNPGSRVNVKLLEDDQVEDSRTTLFVLWGAVAFVLLIAAANVANLMLARANARQAEIAIRVALGASRGRIVRQLLTESVLLALIGGALGTLLALWGVDALRPLMPVDLPRRESIRLDWMALSFTMGVALFTGVLFGLLPALRSADPDLHSTLKDGRASAGRPRQRLRNALVISEVALSLVLLIGAGLLLRSFGQLTRVRPGFDADHVLTFALSLPSARYDKGAAINRFQDELRLRLAALPGVKSVALAAGLPFLGASDTGVSIVGRPPLPGGEDPQAMFYPVTPDYLEVMHIPLLRGRFFTEADRSQPVAVIDEGFARRLFPDQEPLGQRIVNGNAPLLIIGVVGHVMQFSLDRPGPVGLAYYVPYAAVAEAQPRGALNLAAVIRTAGDPRALEADARKAVLEVDRELPVFGVSTMEEALARSIADRRFSMLLLSIFAGLALVLATVGIYGVMSYTVSQRTREIGIRVALGAQESSVLRLVVGQGARLALIGVLFGLGGALLLSRALQSLLFSVSSTDPLTYAGLALLLGAVSVAACLFPALKAARVDPVIALRAE